MCLLPMFEQGGCILKAFPTARASDGDIKMLPDVGQDTIKIGVLTNCTGNIGNLCLQANLHLQGKLLLEWATQVLQPQDKRLIWRAN